MKRPCASSPSRRTSASGSNPSTVLHAVGEEPAEATIEPGRETLEEACGADEEGGHAGAFERRTGSRADRCLAIVNDRQKVALSQGTEPGVRASRGANRTHQPVRASTTWARSRCVPVRSDLHPDAQRRLRRAPPADSADQARTVKVRKRRARGRRFPPLHSQKGSSRSRPNDRAARHRQGSTSPA